MAYLHCHNCGWEQDDFWEKDAYTPFRHDLVEYLEDILFTDRAYDDEFVFVEMGFPEEQIHHDDHGWWVKGTDWVARKLEQKARSIRNMAVRTNAEWEKVRDVFTCPECGTRDELCID